MTCPSGAARAHQHCRDAAFAPSSVTCPSGAASAHRHCRNAACAPSLVATDFLPGAASAHQHCCDAASAPSNDLVMDGGDELGYLQPILGFLHMNSRQDQVDEHNLDIGVIENQTMPGPTKGKRALYDTAQERERARSERR